MVERNHDVKKWYERYYTKYSANRNDLRGNPEVLFQTLAQEASVVRAASRIFHDPASAAVLDVGCGNGGNFYQLVRLGYRFVNISGIDVNDERVALGMMDHPTCHFYCADASKMEFEGNTFDLVFESTMFSTLPDDKLCKAISSEMVRVCKPGGYLLLVDWRYKKPKNPNYNALSLKKTKEFFAVGTETELITIENGALVPPIGRSISKTMPSLYFVISSIFPFLVGQVVYVLKKFERS